MVGITICSAAEATTKHKYYISATLGTAFPDKALDNKEQYYAVKKKPAYSAVYGLGLGCTLTERLRSEIQLSLFPAFNYREYSEEVFSSYDKTSNKLVAFNLQWHYRQKFRTILIAAALYYDIGNFNSMVPYVSIGVGLSKNTAGSLSVQAMNLPKNGKADPPTVYVSGTTKNNFAWAIGAGLTYRCNDRISLNLFDYKYQDLGFMVTKGNNSLRITSKLAVHVFSVGFKVYF